MKQPGALNARDRRQLLLACLLGASGGGLVMVFALHLGQLEGMRRLTAEGPLLLLSVVLGAVAGLSLFLQRELWQPLNQLLQTLPRRATDAVPLKLRSGIAALKLLLERVNGLLAQQRNTTALQQRQCNDLAHDIRAPLTRLLLRVDALRQQQPQDPELVAGLKADLETLLELDDQLGEIGQGSAEFRRERVTLEPCFRQIAASYTPAAVLVQVDPKLTLLVDRRLLQRTLHNLIDNALDHGGTPVVITTETSPESLVILVEDAGSGNSGSPPNQSRLHQGLGWRIARRFCRSHGGEMSLGPSPLGGLQVRLALPEGCLAEPGA